MHALLEARLKGQITDATQLAVPDESDTIELEAQAMFAAYCAYYPVEPFDVVDVERVFKVPIEGSTHRYIGKFDGVVRYNQREPLYAGQLAIIEHKTESRSALRNLPEAWAARAQVSLYKYAAEILYQEPIAHIILDVLRRQSPKGQEPATFYRDTLERTPEQVEHAIKDIDWVANQIVDLSNQSLESWPQNTDNCVQGRFKCDYYSKHILGDTPELIQLRFKKAEEYLQL